jgi:cation-transporting P-type ATPase J
MRSWWRVTTAGPETRWALIATGLFAAGGLTQLAGGPAPVWWALYLGCYAAGGWEPGLSGLRTLRTGALDVDLLMIVAAVAAAAIGQVFDGALLIVIFATSGALESFVTRRTADSVRALLDLAPERASRLDLDGTEQEVDTADLVVGDIVVVRPGERVGTDGTILDGLSEVDQASITGEPLPVAKAAGDRVFAGTVNGTGSLRVRVSTAAADSVVARIVTLVEEASATKARRQLFVERVESRYSLVVVAATLALVAVPLLAGAEFQPTLLRAMTFMIVASPCAVVLATMPPLLSVIANAGRHGLLIKSAAALEVLADVDQVVFDKTGTLTEGTPRVTAVEPFGDHDPDTLLVLAAAAERRSEHPLAHAMVTAAADRGLAVPEPAEFGSVPGRGVTATVDGRRIEVGAPVLLARVPAGARARAGPEATVRGVEATGRTAVVVLVDGEPAGVLALADRHRPGARGAIAELRALTGHEPVLLTGDNSGAAGLLATEVGIGTIHSGLLPDRKVELVRALQSEGRRVALVGDGVNDAPALAAADVGIAMGQRGADLSLETADAVVIQDDLATVPAALALARRARRVVRANIAFAAAVITTLVLVDLLGTLPLPLGVAGHEGSTVIVGLNGLRLLRRAAWPSTKSDSLRHDRADTCAGTGPG